MERNNLIHYIEKILRNKKTKEEEDQVDQHFVKTFQSGAWDIDKLGNKEEREQNILSGVESQIRRNRTYQLKKTLQYAASIAAVVLLSAILWQYVYDKGGDISSEKGFLNPGKDIALLELGDGTQLNLSDLREGEKYERSGFIVVKNEEGDLEYTYENTDNSAPDEWNTLKTPMGGKYRIVLADGTKVWLNAGSTLVFPSNFAQNQRLVKASGEVYFEVSKDKTRPFIVQSNGFDIQVVGTAFNLSAYDDQWSKSPSVALVEGLVDIKTARETSRLVPGHKATLGSQGVAIVQFDVESEIAWKDNYFIFKDQNIKEIMSVLARWYDAEVVYKGNGWHDKNYTIRMSRHEKIEDVLSIIELTKSVKFQIEERRITVYNTSR